MVRLCKWIEISGLRAKVSKSHKKKLIKSLPRSQTAMAKNVNERVKRVKRVTAKNRQTVKPSWQKMRTKGAKGKGELRV